MAHYTPMLTFLDKAGYRRKFKSTTVFQMCGDYTDGSQVQRLEIPERELRCLHSEKRRGHGTGELQISGTLILRSR